MSTNFQNWMDRFITEKNIDLSEMIKCGDGTSLYVGDVLSHILSTSKEEQNAIKFVFIQIDFKNGNVLDFIKHLAQALNKSHRIGMQ